MTTPQEPAMGVSDQAVNPLLARAYELVHHDIDCPAIGGNGEDDCRCDAVKFLDDLKAALPHMQPAGEAVALLREVCGELTGAGCGPCVGSDAPMEDLHGRIARFLATPPQPSAEPQQEAQGAVAVELTKCCGREECGGECGNEWRGTEFVRVALQAALGGGGGR